MALQTLNTIKDWFKTGLKPSQTQFWDTWDSFRHKNDKVPVKEVEGLDEILDQLPPKTVYESGQLLVFKNPGNESGNNFLEPDDTVIGFVEGDFLNAGTYYGGDPTKLNSYINRIGEVISFVNGLLTVNLNEAVISRFYASAELSCIVRITTLEGTIFEHGINPVEMELNNPISVYIQGKYDYGSTIVIYDLLDEFVESVPFIYSFVQPEEQVIEDVSTVNNGGFSALNLFYNNIERNENGQAINLIEYIDKDYNYLGQINQGLLPSPTNVVRDRYTGQKVAEFTVLNANFFQLAFDLRESNTFQLTMDTQNSGNGIGLFIQLYPSGLYGTPDFWNDWYLNNLRTVIYSNDGLYRETDLQSNIFGDWESLIRIKTKINNVN